MTTQHHRMRAGGTALLLIALFTLGFAASAQAKLTGEFTRFAQCPYITSEEARKCLFAQTEGGEVILGSKKVPITKTPITLQGAYGAPGEDGFSPFFGAKNGVTLAKVPQPVPGGLAGLVSCPEIENFILRAACEWTFENGLTGVNSTLELARPASEIEVNENNLGGQEGVAFRLPVKFRLENPLLGSNCYVGSEATPVMWELTSGKTNPPPPNESIEGGIGAVEFFEGGSIIQVNPATLVDNAWSAPAAKGCGGLFAFILDPIINTASGLPSKAGQNTAILINDSWLASALATKINDEENP
jgi:hypothetical protein